MIDRDASPALRMQFTAAILAFVALAGASAWVGIATLAHALQRSAAHAPLIAFRPLYVTGLPVAVAFLALAVLALLPRRVVARKGGGRRGTGRRGIDAARIMFGVVVVSLLAAIITTPVAGSAMDGVMRDRGYRACPAPDAERRPPMRWVRDDGRCP